MLTLGADPEYLLSDGIKFVSAIGRVLGSKKQPHEFSCGSVHPDNVACEINTIPATCADSFCENVGAPLDYIGELLEAQRLILADESTAHFDDSELQSPEAREAGCEPDFNAYRGGEINAPPCLWSTNMRSAAGHVHVGYELDEYEVPLLVKTLDLYVTIPSLHLESPERRTLYGRAGCYRRKPYGVEYRTPSNHWTFIPSRRKWMWNMVEQAIADFRILELPADLESVINDHDLIRGAELVHQYQLELCPSI